MTSKKITLTINAYEALSREKREGENLSDVILRLTARRNKLKDYLGLWKLNDEEKKVFAHMKHS